MPVVLKVFVLALVQGFCELLPVSSSAHVIIAEKLMGLDPTTPAMTFLLVMLHTGTMLAVIVYFWSTWRRRFFSSAAAFRSRSWSVPRSSWVLREDSMKRITNPMPPAPARHLSVKGCPHELVNTCFSFSFAGVGCWRPFVLGVVESPSFN